MRAQPAAGPAAPGAGDGALRPPRARLALLAWTLGGAAALAAIVLVALTLTAARVPQHRAALEALIRRETGLEVSFSELSLHWGWYGPEALFSDVVLGERGGGARLRAPRLSVALDAWRTLRSGELAAGRITLLNPDIDFTAGRSARAAQAAPTSRPGPGVRLLSNWRGERIELEGGTLRWAGADAAALAVGIRHAELRRAAAQWDADAELALPAALGASAHLALHMRGDPAVPEGCAGSFSFNGRLLELGAWRALIEDPRLDRRLLDRYLPQAGRADLELHARFAEGRLQQLDGTLAAQALAWRAPDPGSTAPGFTRVRAAWQLQRTGGQWQLAVPSLVLGEASALSLSAALSADGTQLHARVQAAPLPLLAQILGWYAPHLPLAQLTLGGTARELAIDWDGARAAGERLRSSALLADLSLATPSGEVEVSELTGRVTLSGEQLLADLEGQGARLSLARAAPLALDGLTLAAHFAVGPAGRGWRLRSDALEIRRGDMSLTASGTLSAARPGARPLPRAHVTLRDADLALLAQFLDPRALAALGLAAAQLPSGHLASASLELDGSRGRAVLEGLELEALAGLPPLGALRGTLEFGGGHLRPSTLAGQWLGGPATLLLREQREPQGSALVISGRGLLEARAALLAAGASAQLGLSGHTEWSARLYSLPAEDGLWRLRADSTLIGLASALPEPFAKTPGAPLPLHLEAQGGGAAGQLRLRLGERLRAIAALGQSGRLWRIERGSVSLGGAAPVLPAGQVLRLEGRLGRLDLPAYLALGRSALAADALPTLEAHLSAAQLIAATHSYPEVSVAAVAGASGGELELESADLSGTAHWPARPNAASPVRLELTRLDAAELGEAALAPAFLEAFGPYTELTIDSLQWQGRALGALSATFTAHAHALEAGELHLAGEHEEASARVHCGERDCRAQFDLASRDAAATLESFGLKPELAAGRAQLSGELAFPAGAPPSLASLAGNLHMQLEQGATRAAEADSGVPFALLAVPALTAGMGEDPDAPQPGLAFTRLSADYALREGAATTTNLHFDGDAEILVRGRVGLAARDYDLQAWVLRGEQRLPAAVRRLGPTPKIAAVWLSLRELLAGAGAQRSGAALRVRGSWQDPSVTQVP